MLGSGKFATDLPPKADEETDAFAKGVCPEQNEPSRCNIKTRLIEMCVAVRNDAHYAAGESATHYKAPPTRLKITVP